MDFYIIKKPSKGTIDILMRRRGTNSKELPPYGIDAVGLVQGKMVEMVVASDIAEKATGVTVEDIRGSCPQNMILLAIFGDTASVEEAMDKIRQTLGKKG